MEQFNLEELLEEFKQGYLNRIENRYDTLDEKSKNDFPFYRCIKYLNLTIIRLNENRTDNEYMIVITNNNEEYQKFIDYSSSESEEFKRVFASISSHYSIDSNEIASLILPTNALQNKIAIYSKFIFSAYDLVNRKMYLYGEQLADSHRRDIHDLQEAPVYSHNNEVQTVFSFLDFEGLIKKVNDKDFEEQMKQAEFCYRHKVYLSAACTFSVCLETVLMLILDKNGVKINEQNTILNSLGDKLREENIISRRDNNRILVTYSIRNATSHTNKTKVIQNDCEGILKTIDYFVDEYLS